MDQVPGREEGVQASEESATPKRPETTTLSETGPQVTSRRRPLLIFGRRAWYLVLLDVMAVAWMATAGSWFDQQGPLAVITLGGHHQLVTTLATLSFMLLAGLSVPTEGFTQASTGEEAVLTAATVLGAVALAGLLSVVLLVLLCGMFVGLLVKLFLR